MGPRPHVPGSGRAGYGRPGPRTSARRQVATSPPPHVGAGRPAFAVRKGQCQLRADQEAWLSACLVEAMRAGVRVSEEDVLRVAADRLRAGDAGWAQLREAILAEMRARRQRR